MLDRDRVFFPVLFLPHPDKPEPLASPALAGGFFTTAPPGKPKGRDSGTESSQGMIMTYLEGQISRWTRFWP